MALFVLFAPKENVFACECMAADVKADVSTAFQKAEIVMMATLESIPDLGPGVEFDQRIVSVLIEKVYKGGLRTGLLFNLGQGRSCDRNFSKTEIGKSFILYIDKAVVRPQETPENPTIFSEGETRYFVSKCGRSALVENAQTDPLFLETKSASNTP